MRKMIVELKAKPLFKMASRFTGFYDHIEKLEGRALLSYDMDKGSKVVIADIYLKDGCSIDELEKLPEIDILNVLKQEGNKYTCFIKVVAKKKHIKKFMHLFDMDVIYSLPFYADREKVVFGVVGESENLKKVMRVLKLTGMLRQVSFTKTSFEENSAISCLTDKQKETIVQAKRSGYYDYPRRIDTQGLADLMGVSKSTVIEHLRKAEGRLMGEILAGY